MKSGKLNVGFFIEKMFSGAVQTILLHSMNKLSFILFILLLINSISGFSQSTNAPLAGDYYHLLDRYEIKQNQFSSQFHSSIKPFQRRAIAVFASRQLDSIQKVNKVDHFNLQFLVNDNWEWVAQPEVKNKPIFKYFYHTKPDLYHIDTDDFDLHVKPILWLESGVETGETRPYINTRGIEFRARIDKKIGFYVFLTENQARFPTYVRARIGEQSTVPGEGFYKGFKQGGVDFFHSRGYVSFDPIRNINIQFGQDRFFIGNGHRSLILSDFGNTYPFLKIQTQLGRFSYTNLFAQLRGNFPGRRTNPSEIKKSLALHHLSLNISESFNVGLFEATIKADSSLNSGIPFANFNPIIFYRTIEHFTRSTTSNVLVGMDAKWNFLYHFQLYCQFVLDEFKIAHMREGKGWWGNKWASQLGIKYIEAFGIQNLDFQLEWNRARPFTYTHSSGYFNYTHYLQPLAHPLGANFDEQLAILHYQPVKRLKVEAQYLQAVNGKDSLKSNVGSNLYLSDYSRSGEFGHKIGQGVKMDLKVLNIHFSYMLAHRLFLDLNQTIRSYSSGMEAGECNYISTMGMRWNIGRREQLY